MSPLARALRTFAAGMVGVLGSVLILVNSGDYKAGAVVLGLGAATAALAGLLAGLAALNDSLTASTPAGKALATFIQMIVAGLGAVVFNSAADLTTFPKLAMTVGVGAIVAAAQTFLQNAAEQG